MQSVGRGKTTPLMRVLDAPTPPRRNVRISMSSSQSGECDIRKDLIESDFVDCIVALPWIHTKQSITEFSHD